MLMEVKNQLKITFCSMKYSIMREMINKASFLLNIIFMIINDASFIIQWIIFFRIKNDIGGYTFNQVLILWGMAAGTFGISRLVFKNAFHLSDLITNGKLDSYLVQPKNVLLGAITSDSDASAIGDVLYGYILLIVSGFSISKLLLFTFLIINGAIIVTSIAVMLASLSFWIKRSDSISDTVNSLMINFATYPDGIFKNEARALLYSIIPVGFTTYIPVQVISEFNLLSLCSVILFTMLMTFVAVLIFYKGLRKYSSSNLMIAKI